MKCKKKGLNIHADDLLKEILNHKGVYDIESFLVPTKENEYDYNLLKNMQKGVDLFVKHLSNPNSKILGIQDCDMDGLASFCMVYNYIYNNFSRRIDYFIHEGKQHGIEVVDDIPEDTDLLIVPDAGSNQISLIRELESKGIEVLCIDHHIMEQEVPDDLASAIINNQDGSYPNTTLSGAGVVYKFLEACDKRLGIEDAHNYMDMAAIGCIGDVMNLNNLETRYIVKEGLRNIKNFGLKTFVNKQGYFIKDFTDISPRDISFYIVPYVNAMIRVGLQTEKEILLKAFLEGEGNQEVPSTKRGKKPGDTEILAEQAFRLCGNTKNTKQKKKRTQAVEFLKLKIAKEELDKNKILVLALDEEESSQVDPNLTGLIAMEIAGEYGKPTILVRKTFFEDYKGSIRADDLLFENFKGFLQNSGFFDFVQGHENAAGCGIADEKAIENFIAYANEELKDYDLSEKTFVVDFDAEANEATYISKLASVICENKSLFGKGVEEPYVLIEKIPLTPANVSIKGKNQDTSEILLANGLCCIMFKNEDFAEKICDPRAKYIDVVGKFNVNVYAGRTTYQLIIEDYNIRKRLEF